MVFDMGTVRGIVTLVLFIAFIGICIWAYSPKRKKKFEQASRLPFEDFGNDESMDAMNCQGKQRANAEIKKTDKRGENSTLNSENSINE